MTKKSKNQNTSEVSLYIHHYEPPFKKTFETKEDSICDFLSWDFQVVYKDANDKKQYVQQLTVYCMLDKYEGKVSFNVSYSGTEKQTFDRKFNDLPKNSIIIDGQLEKKATPIALTIDINDYKDLHSLLNSFIENEIFVKLDSIESSLKKNPIVLENTQLNKFVENAKEVAKKTFNVPNFNNIKDPNTMNDILLFNYLEKIMQEKSIVSQIQKKKKI